MADASETPRISRSGRILKKTSKLREMEDAEFAKNRIRIGSCTEDGGIRRASVFGKMSKRELFSDTEVSKRASEVPSRYSVTKSSSSSFPDLDKTKFCAVLDWHGSGDSSTSEIELIDSETESSEDCLENLPKYDESLISGGDTLGNGESSFENSNFETNHDLPIKKITAKSYENDPDYLIQSSGPVKSMAVVKRDITTSKCNVLVPQPRAKRLTSFMLWRSHNKWRFNTSHKSLNTREKAGALWKALPNTEKVFWKRKAMQISLQNSSISSCLRSAELNRMISIDDPEYLLPEEKASLGCKPIDVAAHLKLLGTALQATGRKLMETNPPLDPTGVQSNLLDVGLCAMASLLCLTREIAGLEGFLQEDVFLRMLDHIAYFFPNM